MKQLALSTAVIIALSGSAMAGVVPCTIAGVHPGIQAFHFKCAEDGNNKVVYGFLNTQANAHELAAVVSSRFSVGLIPGPAGVIPCNAQICPGTPDAGGGGSATAIQSLGAGVFSGN